MKMSVCIPTSKMVGGEDFFRRLLDSLWNQSFQDFEIIVSDNSDDNKILDICQYYGSINYQRNKIKGMAQNTNHALRRAEGYLIKLLYMDDYLAHDDVLKDIDRQVKQSWAVSGCVHLKDGFLVDQHIPSYNDEIQFGKNTIGSPSVLTIKREDLIFFDEEMTWLLDCDYYKRLHDLYGPPLIMRDVQVVIGVGPHQATNTMGEERKLQEQKYILEKYHA